MLNDLSSFSPASFFSVSFKIEKDEKRLPSSAFLPDFSELLNEKKFARIALFWNEKGIRVYVQVKKILEGSGLPNYREGDSLELFFDTRDLKSTQSVTRFCHHFVFFPDGVDGIKAKEIPHFRQNETHELAESNLFVVNTEVKRKEYETEIHIPKEALHGYDPASFKRLGFAYQINRYGGEPQHFPISSRFFSLEKHPELWATLIL